ncbi:kinase-like domain-containing protein [Rhizophagus irregularis DAOM 181602=DAOM 197198]|uniref:Kinase-like domain-containing protein n=1 Tax=Rhizophagus irregularis (strain DAOM 181602 / DAOM 197198 / MUCL 43194) TaxID=747089 RepID=A0A2P4QEL6_RHIID|nr:kinase-like domain-containing protein [Rhizophagus irregularis DAOM 181602=DAOM 197198]POG76078.1 kinase-like domain-containing protein [Rhizophagus irregularis DAOM 181602=DAOM 197198]|eukprot:XP_025182944.1 kinase-like domain-containing protein [Rhizophagus irregularis DAOM 181602=DAOM 197198]
MEQSDNTCNRDSFDPIPKLKSSPVPILFVPFNQDDENCFNCGNKYFKPLLIQQKYCENCLSKYVTSITDNEMYLDVHISTKDVHCKEHETSRDKNFCTLKIQEWCKNCSIISWFKQIVSHPLIPHFYAIDIEKQNKVIEIEEDCKLCGKLIQRFSEFYKFRICSDCYHISSGWIKSAYKKYIPILYLPWWDTANKCMTCGNLNLIFSSNSQKWCPSCYTLYAGCRYCLTTNIIFGLTYQSQCRKCERIIYISSDILKSSSGHDDIDEFLHCVRINIKTIHKIANYEDNINKDHNLLNVYELMTCVVFRLELSIQWIPYSQITILNEIAKGGYSIVYKAIWSHSESMYKSYYYEYNRGELQVALKKFLNSRDVKKYFLNELKSHYVHNYCGNIILCYGVTMDPATNDYMLVMQYANGGTLHNYLQIHFSAITWKEKIWIIYRISDGLRIIHAANFVHRDFHSGNILYTNSKYEVIYADLGEHAKVRWHIGDLGLSHPANDSLFNKEIYGVIPYIAPEIFKGAKFSQASDIYSLGMIMWECTTGCKPFANIEHDHNLVYNIIDGKRPEITEDTPEFLANLMKRCWDSDPKNRPTAWEIKNSIYSDSAWKFSNYEALRLQEAEQKRLELIRLKKLGPEFIEKPHSKAIYTSRPLSSLYTNSSNSLIKSLFSVNSLNTKQGYISREYEFDIKGSQR